VKVESSIKTETLTAAGPCLLIRPIRNWLDHNTALRTLHVMLAIA